MVISRRFRRGAMSRLAAFVVLLVLAATVGGCSSKTYSSPEIVGIVQSAEPGHTSIHLTLTDGREFELNNGTAGSQGYVGNLGGYLSPGDLFFGGSKPSPWYGTAEFQPGFKQEYQGCYLLTGTGTETNEVLEFDVGVRLFKAADFRDADHIVNGPGKGFRDEMICLDQYANVMGIVSSRY